MVREKLMLLLLLVEAGALEVVEAPGECRSWRRLLGPASPREPFAVGWPLGNTPGSSGHGVVSYTS